MINFKFIPLFFVCAQIGITNAMDMRVVENHLIMSGNVVSGDLGKFESFIKDSPAIDTVILRNSHGGDIHSGYRIGEIIRTRGLSTAVSGYCISSCSRMFLGGKKRLFTDDYQSDRTYIGFHGHYDSSGNLNRGEVNRNGLYEWIIKYSDGKADKELVKRWIDIHRNTGMVAFMHPSAKNSRNVKAFICNGNEQKRPITCESLDADALTLGVITETKYFQSADKDEILHRGANDEVASGYAAIDDTQKVPLDNPAGIDNYKKYLKATAPKAFAVAKNRNNWAWNSAVDDAIELALKRCEDRSGQKCILYAVNEVVVYQGQ